MTSGAGLEQTDRSRKDEARGLVWRSFIRKARADSELERLIGREFGIFRFMDVVDLIVDELITWQDGQTDLPARVEALRSQNADLMRRLDAIGTITKEAPRPTGLSRDTRVREFPAADSDPEGRGVPTPSDSDGSALTANPTSVDALSAGDLS